MELGIILLLFAALVGGILGLKWPLRSINSWIYERKLGEKRLYLPPGDLGYPFIGNMLPFLKAFKSTDPDSFVANLISKYGSVGIFRTMMFGFPSVIITTPEGCRKVLTDDEAFEPGWPVATVKLIGEKSFISIPYEEHKRLRKLTAAPVNGHEALSVYLKYIEENVIIALDKWSGMGEIEYLTQLRKLTFRIIMHIFMCSAGDDVREALENEYTTLNHGVRAMAINIPGFAYRKALKARKRLVAVLQSVIDERRIHKKENPTLPMKDMLDALMDAVDEKGKKLGDEDIIDILIMYLNAGHESSGHSAMWATLFLQKHPEVFQKAKAEQEEILKNRPPEQKGLTLKEIRKMEYLSKVIDETMRIVTFSLFVFRVALKDVKINGYIIPKGWRVLTWFRELHYNPTIYPDPKKFDPSRWDDLVPKAGSFLPFGAGSRLCPGNDLAKLEISIYLHHFLLNYKFEWKNPKCEIQYLPHQRPKDNCLGRIVKV